jgi:hypothetical protein
MIEELVLIVALSSCSSAWSVPMLSTKLVSTARRASTSDVICAFIESKSKVDVAFCSSMAWEIGSNSVLRRRRMV